MTVKLSLECVKVSHSSQILKKMQYDSKLFYTIELATFGSRGDTWISMTNSLF